MSVARGFVRLANRYEINFEVNREAIIEERIFHITQLREAIEAANHLLEISYKEFENWADSLQALYEVNEFDNFFERLELIYLKWYVSHRYSQSVKEIQDTEAAKKKMEKVLRNLEIIGAFR